VIQEGLCGRYAGGFNFAEKPYLNGQYCYEPIYRSASPTDIVVLALGTNDFKDKRFNRTSDEIVNDILWYEGKTQTIINGMDNGETMPDFLYILPPNFTSNFRGLNKEKREIVNAKLQTRVKNFIKFDDIELSADGAHFSPRGHERMAEAVFNKVMEMEK
jgi:lysophospholipase L1-like esterase